MKKLDINALKAVKGGLCSGFTPPPPCAPPPCAPPCCGGGKKSCH